MSAFWSSFYKKKQIHVTEGDNGCNDIHTVFLCLITVKKLRIDSNLNTYILLFNYYVNGTVWVFAFFIWNSLYLILQVPEYLNDLEVLCTFGHILLTITQADVIELNYKKQ